MDIRVLKEDGTEVELKENLDDTDMNLHRLLEGDRRYRDNEREDIGSYGYTTQQFNDKGDLENVEEDEYTSGSSDEDEEMSPEEEEAFAESFDDTMDEE